MAAFRERNNPVRLLGKRFLLFLTCVAIIFILPGVWKVYVQERESRSLKNDALRELSELRTREEFLREKTEALDTPYGLEAALREQFSLARNGEKLIVIIENESTRDEEEEPASDLMYWFNSLLSRQN